MKVKENNKFIIFGAIVVIVLLIIAIRLMWNNRPVDLSKLSEEEITEYYEGKIENIEKKDLSEKGERDRMERYVASFVKAIEKQEYEKAYEMLYDDYKVNFFPTLESFTEYAKTKFPKFASLEHTNIERLGDIYVLWVNLYDSLGSKNAYKEIKFVVEERDLNDFKLSFSADL